MVILREGPRVPRARSLERSAKTTGINPPTPKTPGRRPMGARPPSSPSPSRDRQQVGRWGLVTPLAYSPCVCVWAEAGAAALLTTPSPSPTGWADEEGGGVVPDCLVLLPPSHQAGAQYPATSDSVACLCVQRGNQMVGCATLRARVLVRLCGSPPRLLG